MSRLLSLFAVIAVAAVAAPGAVSADDPLQSSLDALAAWDPGFAALAADPPSAGNQMVVGSLRFRLQEFPMGFEHIRISAHSGPAGEDPKGQVHITSTVPGLETDEMGDVVCLDAIGRVSPFIGPTAFVWARLREPHQGFPFVQLQIRDNGNPGEFLGNSPDDAYRGYTLEPPPPDCAAGGFEFGVEKSGNMIVRDAP